MMYKNMVDKLGLQWKEHPNPYKVSRLQKRHNMLTSEKCIADF